MAENKTTQKVGLTMMALFMIFLILNLPLIEALTIWGVTATNITENSAIIRWNTDEPANSFARYGITPENFQSIGDANKVREHHLQIVNLNQSTEYKYAVQSNEIADDKGGSYYTFTTLAPDTSAPQIEITIPAFAQGTKVTFSGKSEASAREIGRAHV